jgi:single stranded DNA-binding protein
MANGLNKAILIGNLGKDPEIRYTPSGLGIANFNIATSETWNNKDGAKETRTEWHRNQMLMLGSRDAADAARPQGGTGGGGGGFQGAPGPGPQDDDIPF